MGPARIVRAVLALAAVAVGACLRPSVFTCDSNANCISQGVQGVCEPTGFCSYPSGDCDSGQRYDEFAGDGLAGTCAEPGASEASGTGPSAVTTTGDSADTGSETGTCPPPVACDDLDGDGYGEGEDCLGPDCDDDNPAHFDACVYVSPEGDDDGAGTREDPWRSFDRALPELSPGQSLVLLDGLYELDTTGLPGIECVEGGNAQSGTADAPISIRAEHERAPVLVGNGSGPAFSLEGCRYWRIFGLRGRNDDRPGSEGGEQSYTFVIRQSEDIVARRLLFSHNNRYFNAHLYGVTNSQRVLIEESEAYFFHREGFFLNESHEVTIRRCYARGNDYPNLPDCVGAPDPELPYCSGTSESGDTGFGAYRGVTSSRFENCIADGPLGAGFRLGATCHDNVMVGSAALGSSNGVVITSEDRQPAERNAVVDCVMVAPASNGVFLRSTTDTTVDGLTVVDAGNNGLSADELTDCTALPGGCSVEARHVLALRSGSSGLVVADHDPWLVDYSNAFGNAQDFPTGEEIGDDEGNIRRSMSVDAGPVGVAQGQCVVFIPDASPVAGAGLDGRDIGASMLYRDEGGPTDEPLWDPQTGAFPCGAVDPGLNDDPALSCIGVHERLNVAAEGCALPGGYGEPGPAC